VDSTAELPSRQHLLDHTRRHAAAGTASVASTYPEMEVPMPKPDDPVLRAWLTDRLRNDSTPPDEWGVMRVFIEECSTPERCRPVLLRFEQAIACGERSSYSINESHAFFDPATQLVTVDFGVRGVFDPPEQTMPAPQFLDLLTSWMTALGSSAESQT
jgi:hypothetical protein